MNSQSHPWLVPTKLMPAMWTALAALKPPSKMTVSQWADANRRLSAEASAEVGQWDTSRAEFQRGIMDCISETSSDKIVLMCSAQVGKTEMLNNVVGYHIDKDPCPILVLQPTIDMAQTWSKDRFTPMIRDTPVLKKKVAE